MTVFIFFFLDTISENKKRKYKASRAVIHHWRGINFLTTFVAVCQVMCNVPIEGSLLPPSMTSLGFECWPACTFFHKFSLLTPFSV